MGTRFEAVLEGEEEGRLLAAGEEALESVEEEDRRWSLFRRESLLTRINDRAGEGPVRLDEEAFELLEACRAIHRDSEGAFDPTVAPRMRSLGFHEGFPPCDDAPVGMDGVVLDAPSRTIRFLRRGVALDLGAIGKGHALDLAAARLRQAGVRCALLHGGTSSAVAIGAPPGKRGWRIGIRGEEGKEPRLFVELRDLSLAVSSPHGRTLVRDGERLGHVLDPRSGRPQVRARAAAAICASARLADGWSTALLVLGERPSGVPADLTSAILGNEGTWRIEGPDRHLFEAR